MSDNKYIIDENSLVGIANVIRDKLGVGTGIDDDEAGYYSAQIKMLGFTQPQDSAAYSGPGSGYTGNWFIYCSVSDIENISGIRPSYVRVTLPTTGSTSARISRFYPTTSTRVASANFTNGVAILSLPADIDNYYLRYEMYYSSYSSQVNYMTMPSYDVAFLDENQEVIDISDYSGKSFSFSRINSGTRNFSTSTKSIAIPYSIDDIQDKITNYLEKPARTPSFHAVINRLNQNPFNVCDYVSSWDDVLYYLIIYKSNWTAMVSGYFPVFTNASGVEIPQARKYLDVIGNDTSRSNDYNFYDRWGIVLDSTKPQGFRTIQQDGTITGSSLSGALSADVKLQFLLYKE